MGVGKGGGALSSAAKAVVATKQARTAPWRRRPRPADRALLEAKKVAEAMAEVARRAAWRSADRVGGYAAAVARRAGQSATRVALAAGESLRRATASKAEEAKLAALRGARHTGAAVGLVMRRAVGLATAQVQRIINDSSMRLMQAVADLASRTLTRQIKADVESKPSGTETRAIKKLSGEGTDIIPKKHCERQEMK